MLLPFPHLALLDAGLHIFHWHDRVGAACSRALVHGLLPGTQVALVDVSHETLDRSLDLDLSSLRHGEGLGEGQMMSRP